MTERLHLFKRDWAQLRTGDAISPQEFDMLGFGKTLRASSRRIAEIVGEPTAEPAAPVVAERRVAARRKPPARPVKTDREEIFRNVEARAHSDPAVRELKLKIHNAKTDEEQAAAWQEHRRALFQKMRDLEPSLKDRIDQAENAPGGAD